MKNDLIIINDNSSNPSSDNSGEDFNIRNNNNFNNLSTNSSNNIDFGEDSSANFNDDEYDEEYSDGNFYQDDSENFYSKGNVYNNDFTEDYPDINRQFKQQLFKDIYEKKEDKDSKSETNDEDEKLKDLPLDFNTSQQFFDIIEGGVEFEPSKVLFKKPYFNAINPEFDNSYNFVYIFSPTLITIASLIFSKNFTVSSVIICLCIISSILSFINVVRTKHFLVLDYYKKQCYFESHTLFRDRIKYLFDFDDIVEIGVSSERKYYYNDSLERYKVLKIIILLKNNESFIFMDSKKNSSFTFSYFNKIAKNLSYALKTNFFDNINQEVLTKSKDTENGIYFITSMNQVDALCSFDKYLVKEKADNGIESIICGVIIILSSLYIIYLIATNL